jgi:hypothetical protein
MPSGFAECFLVFLETPKMKEIAAVYQMCSVDSSQILIFAILSSWIF